MARPQSRGGMNMSSQAGRGPPSGMRLGTRGGMQQQQQNGQPLQSVGLSTNVVVDNRPVTRQGLTGMHTKPLGPGRQIADDRYFVNELRSRINDIVNEMQALEDEKQKIESDNSTYRVQERKYEKTIEDVKRLEGELADFNLALDKLRTNTSPESILESAAHLASGNKILSNDVDDIFSQTQGTQKRTNEVKDKIAKIYEEAQSKLERALDQGSVEEYKTLQATREQLQQESEEKEAKISSLDARIQALQDKSQTSKFQLHVKGLGLKKKKTELMTRRQELEEDTDANLSPEEMRERLREKVKAMNKDIETLQRQLKTHETNFEKMQGAIRSKEEELTELQKHSQKAKKYEAVYERDRKMQEFIDEFESVYAQETHNLSKLRSTVVALMKHISKQMASSENLPDVQQLAEMKNELTFKEQKLKNSKNTLTLLNADLALRREELEKINVLDKKISQELKALEDKIQSMKIEMSQFKSDEELRSDATEAKKKLLQQKQRTKKLRDASNHQVQVLGQAFDKRKRELVGNETMKRMDALEQKLRVVFSTVYSLQDFINTRKRESDYMGINTEVKEVTAAINKHIIEQINSK